MADFKIIFVHGYTASHLADWYPNISRSLDELGIDYAVPDLPGDRHPHPQDWLDIIDREVKASTKPVVLVGHSLGTRTVLLYLDQYRIPVKAAFLIAAFANWVDNARRKGGDAYPDFFTHKLDIEAIRKLSEKFVVIHSTNDDSIDFKQGEEIAEQLGAKLITFEDRGHMSASDNAPYVLAELRKELVF